MWIDYGFLGYISLTIYLFVFQGFSPGFDLDNFKNKWKKRKKSESWSLSEFQSNLLSKLPFQVGELQFKPHKSESHLTVEELNIQQRWKKISMWSEKTASQMSKLETHRPCESAKSSVCPSSWVGPHKDCTKLRVNDI